MDLRERWDSIRLDLNRARNLLPADAGQHSAIREYHEFCSHNELELACDMLELYARDHRVNSEFWNLLRDAAAKMDLQTAVQRYEALARSS